ncbi:hypothetical protein P5X87_00010 [Microbacterium sp. RD10]|uniref:hypothetical protein n=2 Tax=Microbacterium TaxID=33882 RepID=UPI001C30473D|nr:hypothetical protein [Microbacterium sp. RD10]
MTVIFGPFPSPTSAPFAMAAPPVQVEVVGDEFLAILGLAVSVIAAVVGLFAAVAAWRAATAARDAARVGEKSAEHAANAADAAQKTAEYERATFELAHQRDVMRQALAVVVSWRGEFSGGLTHGATVEVQNTSGLLISQLEVWAVKNGERVTEVKSMQDLGSVSQTFSLAATVPFVDFFAPAESKGVVRFTDSVGLRWERRSYEAPISVDEISKHS